MAVFSFTSFHKGKKRSALLRFAEQDHFFESIVDSVLDYGIQIDFSYFGGAGVYQPFALETEALDTAEKQAQFAHGFWKMSDSGALKAKIGLSKWRGVHGNAHSFLHELMHFYQDMNGLYLMPLKEQGVFPVMLDARSDIVAILFCEAWAETEAIRASWSIKEKGDDFGWRGALASPDWASLACAYDADLQAGVDEAKAAADTFKRWYKGKHREFYERHALSIHQSNLKRYEHGANVLPKNFRALYLPDLIARIPAGERPPYFDQIDWADDLFTQPQSVNVGKQAENTNIQEIKCGAPAYIWNRLRHDALAKSEIPPQSFSTGEQSR